jgi:rubredoxin
VELGKSSRQGDKKQGQSVEAFEEGCGLVHVSSIDQELVPSTPKQGKFIRKRCAVCRHFFTAGNAYLKPERTPRHRFYWWSTDRLCPPCKIAEMDFGAI